MGNESSAFDSNKFAAKLKNISKYNSSFFEGRKTQIKMLWKGNLKKMDKEKVFVNPWVPP